MSPRLLSKAALVRRANKMAVELIQERAKREALESAVPIRAMLRRIDALLEVLAHPVQYGEPISDQKYPRFVHVFTAQRGYYHALIALDASGQLWERHQTIDEAVKPKRVIEEWWEKLPMERRG